jgi:TRAP transporter TAXI family solute receptor
MKSKTIKGAVAAFSAFLVLATLAFENSAVAKTSFISIGTGGVTGVYYPTGGAIAKLVNAKKELGIKANVESTAGSVFNVNAIMSGNQQFGIVQADKQFQALNGEAEWKESGSQKKLRSVFSLHSEAVTLVAAADKKITSLKDLKGKRVNLGSPGTGQRSNATDILNVVGINPDKDIKAESLSPAEAPGLLQDDRIDAFFYTVGHPNGAIQQVTNGARKVTFVPITGMDSLIKRLPFYSLAVIPKEAYPNASNKTDVNTIGMKATFVTSEDVPEDVVYNVTKVIFENLEELKTLHPALARLAKEEMVQGLSAPLHKGAAKYFREIGLTKSISPELLK